MKDYAAAFVNVLNKLYKAQGISSLSEEQGILLAVLLREMELPGPRKTVDQIITAAEKAIGVRLRH